MIAPVNTAYLMDKTGWSVLTMKDKQTVQKDVKELALYSKSFRDAFAHDPSKRFNVVDNSGPNTLVAEMAITELVPSSPALGALGSRRFHGGDQSGFAAPGKLLTIQIASLIVSPT